MKKLLTIALMFPCVSALANATITLQDQTGYGLKVIAASYATTPGTTIGDNFTFSLPIMDRGQPLADTAQIVDAAYPYFNQGPYAPQGSISWSPTNDGNNDYEFDLFAGGKPWGIYTKTWCINLNGNKKCTNPNSDWDPAKIIVPNFVDGSSVTITLTTN